MYFHYETHPFYQSESSQNGDFFGFVGSKQALKKAQLSPDAEKIAQRELRLEWC